MTGRSRPPRLDREVLTLALPATASGLSLLFLTWVDTWWVGRLEEPEAPLAALSIAMFTVWIFGSVASLLAIGLTALVARYVGSGRIAAAAYVAHQGIAAAIGIGILAAACGWVFAPYVYSLITDDPAVNELGTAYVRIFWLGGSTILVQRACDAVFRAHGNARTPFLLSLVSLGLNAALDPLLLFGWGPIPALGVPGVALATVLSAGITAAWSVAILRRTGWFAAARPPDAELRLTETTRLGEPGLLGIDAVLFRRIARVGLPVFYSGVLFSLIYLVISRTAVAAGGTAAQAALGLGHRGEGVAFVLSNGFAAAAASLIGRRLGEGDPAAAEKAAWRAVLHCGAACGLWALFLLLGDDELAAFFAPPGATRDLAAAYYRIVSISLIPQAAEIVLEGAFGGAGLTLPPMVISITLSALRIPLSWWVAGPLGLGVTGIWWVISLTAVARGAAMVIWFRRGTWKEHSV